MPKIIFLNGRYLPLKGAGISPCDLGLLRGYGVFDFMVTANGRPFMFSEHWKRFKNSAQELNLAPPLNEKQYKEIVSKLLRLNKIKNPAIRTVLTGGISNDGLTPARKGTFLIMIEKRHTLPAKLYEKGAGVITVEHFRDCPEAKTSNYIIAIKNISRRIREKAAEILYVYQGKASEASTSNFFIVKNKILITPHEDILFGITRKLTIMLAKRKGFKIKERELKVKELYSADEVFLTASNKDIVPIVRINGKKIGSGKPGKITMILMEEFRKFVENY